MTSLDKDIAYVYLAERTNVGYENQIKIRNVTDSNGILFVTFDAILQTFGDMNRNKRIYDQSNIWDCIMTEKIQGLLRQNAWFGEADHPSVHIKGQELTSERIQSIDWDRRCILIKEPHMVGDTLQATIQTVPGTKYGEGLAKDIIALNWHPGFSCRSIAVARIVNGKPVVFVRKLITYDSVIWQSHPRALGITEPKIIKREFTYCTESANDSDAFNDDVMIPCEELIKDVCKKDINAQMIMESFELTADDAIGFDEHNKHLVFKDKDNTIYTKIHPETRKMMDDFLSSF